MFSDKHIHQTTGKVIRQLVGTKKFRYIHPCYTEETLCGKEVYSLWVTVNILVHRNILRKIKEKYKTKGIPFGKMSLCSDCIKLSLQLKKAGKQKSWKTIEKIRIKHIIQLTRRAKSGKKSTSRDRKTNKDNR